MDPKLKQEQKQLKQLKAPQQIDQQEAQQPVRQQMQQPFQQKIDQQTQQLNQQAKVHFPPAHADAVANGAPFQQQAPAQKTYKERRAEKRHAKEAKDNTGGVGNIVTYDIKHQLEDYNTQRENSYKSYLESRSIESLPEDVDERVLRFFSHGFRKDRAGNPATPDDLKYQQEDAALYDAFCSKDFRRRIPYLQRMVEEALSLNLKEDMFSDSSMRNNAAGMKSIAGRLVSMDNVMNDELNMPFFASLSIEKKEALEQVRKLGASFSAAFTAECHKRGVEANGSYMSKENVSIFSNIEKDHVAKYQETLGTYQTMKDTFKQAKEKEERLDSGLYQEIRKSIKDDIQKLLDCNVEELRVLSNKDLQRRRAELNELYAASLNVDKCLELKNPDRCDSLGEPLTLKDDLIGLGIEYKYKSAVLRGLVERAAGFKNQGMRTIEDAAKLHQIQMTPGTGQFKDFFGYLMRHDLPTLVVVPAKFDAVTAEFTEESHTEEIAKAVKRLKKKHYFSLAERSDIGEALFRSFNSFLRLEAAQTLLTPEQFKQMLLNLGAGADLTHDSPAEERAPAIEKNNAGLDTLREVLNAQYDMLERKYGNGIEQMTIKDIMEHYLDIGRDFSNVQVDYNMATRFPGFVRKNPDDGKDNPDDVRLSNRIKYYNQCSISIAAIIPIMAGGVIQDPASGEVLKISDENLQKYFSSALTNIGKVRDDLMEDKKCHLQHPFDWSQKVKKPADGN